MAATEEQAELVRSFLKNTLLKSVPYRTYVHGSGIRAKGSGFYVLLHLSRQLPQGFYIPQSIDGVEILAQITNVQAY